THRRKGAGGGADQRQRRPRTHRAGTPLPLRPAFARARRGQAGGQYLPRRLRTVGLLARRGAARRRPHRDGRARRRARGAAQLLDRPRNARLAARRHPPRPALRFPRRAGRLARRGIAPPRQGRHRMTLPNGFAERDPALSLRPLYLVNRDGLDAWRGRQPTALVQWMIAHGFDAAAGSQLTLPGDDGAMAGAVLGVGDALDPFSYAHAPMALPGGHWEV